MLPQNLGASAWDDFAAHQTAKGKPVPSFVALSRALGTGRQTGVQPHETGFMLPQNTQAAAWNDYANYQAAAGNPVPFFKELPPSLRENRQPPPWGGAPASPGGAAGQGASQGNSPFPWRNGGSQLPGNNAIPMWERPGSYRPPFRLEDVFRHPEMGSHASTPNLLPPSHLPHGNAWEESAARQAYEQLQRYQTPQAIQEALGGVAVQTPQEELAALEHLAKHVNVANTDLPWEKYHAQVLNRIDELKELLRLAENWQGSGEGTAREALDALAEMDEEERQALGVTQAPLPYVAAPEVARILGAGYLGVSADNERAMIADKINELRRGMLLRPQQYPAAAVNRQIAVLGERLNWLSKYIQRRDAALQQLYAEQNNRRKAEIDLAMLSVLEEKGLGRSDYDIPDGIAAYMGQAYETEEQERKAIEQRLKELAAGAAPTLLEEGGKPQPYGRYRAQRQSAQARQEEMVLRRRKKELLQRQSRRERLRAEYEVEAYGEQAFLENKAMAGVELNQAEKELLSEITDSRRAQIITIAADGSYSDPATGARKTATGALLQQQRELQRLTDIAGAKSKWQEALLIGLGDSVMTLVQPMVEGAGRLAGQDVSGSFAHWNAMRAAAYEGQSAAAWIGRLAGETLKYAVGGQLIGQSATLARLGQGLVSAVPGLGALSPRLATQLLGDMVLDMALDTLPNVVLAGIARGEDAGAIALQAVGSIFVNAGLNTGAAAANHLAGRAWSAAANTGNAPHAAGGLPPGQAGGIINGGSPKAPFHIDFYVGPGGRALPAQYHAWLGTNMREVYLNAVDNAALKRTVDVLYRVNAIIGDGGTADVLRFEMETGLLLSANGHLQKARDRLVKLNRILHNESLSQHEEIFVEQLIKQLTDVLER